MESDKSAFQPIDLVGKVIIKVQLGDDIRKVLIHNESITYDELLLMMQRIFNGKLTANDDLTIKYKDEDGDLITVFDSQDLSFALQTSRVLKLQVFMNNFALNERPTPRFNNEEFKKQLRHIRNAVTWLLDTIDDNPEVGNNNTDTLNPIEQEEPSVLPPQPSSDNGVAKEFDPLRNSQDEEPKSPQPVLQVKSEPSQENMSTPQSQCQTPPIQQCQIQNTFNGQSQGVINQHNPYSGGQIPQQQGSQDKWMPYTPTAMRLSYPAQNYYGYPQQLPGYNQVTPPIKPQTGNPPVHSVYYPASTTSNTQYTTNQYPGQ